MIHKIILTAVEHPLWGTILQPLLTEEKTTFSLQVLEIANSKADYFPDLNEVQQKIITLSEKYTDKALMKLYSKEKITSDFLKKVDQTTIQHYIRPCIENYHKQIISLLILSDIPLYIREGSKTRIIYDSDEVSISKEPAKAIFNFVKEEKSGFRYFIQVKWKEVITSLKDMPYKEIASNPAVVIVNQQLFVFEDIDTKKLHPFFTRSYINIPPASEKAYIEKFVVNCVKEYEVHAKGIPIRKVVPEQTALLSLENDYNQRPVLCLAFQYDNHIFPFHTTGKIKKNTFPVYHNEETEIIYFERDTEWENDALSLLIAHGLEVYRDHYLVISQKDHQENEEETYLLIDWIQKHAHILSGFIFSQEGIEKVYYTGEISLNTTLGSGQDWFDLQSVVMIGNFRIPFSQFRQHILEGIREYVLPDGKIAILPKEWFSRYYEIMLFGKKNGNHIRLKKHHFYLISQLNDTHSRETLPDFNPETLFPAPQGLKATLRPYQQKGFSWLLHLYENHFGGCLADDMGLGKTLQTIALLYHIYIPVTGKLFHHPEIIGPLFLFDEQIAAANKKEKINPSIIVVPTSLMHNWLNELRKFAPELKIYSYSGNKRLKSKDIGKVFAYYHIVLTTYGVLRNDIDLLQHACFHYLILDESQYVKNPSSQAYKAVKQIQAEHKLILTGTPIENSLSDLWAQFEIINEGVLGSFNSFRKAYMNPIQQKKNKEKEAVLLKMIRPFLLRRTKTEVAPELPPLTEKMIYCDMSPAQEKVYLEEKNKVRNSLLSEVSKPPESSRNTSFIALQGLTRLRLLANHPVLLDKEYTENSGKFEQIIMHFENLKAENHKVLVFSSFVKHLQVLAHYFDKQNWKYAWLTGSVQAMEREKEINKFNRQKDINCFFISLKAGGVGLNLTEADYVFIIDPWWNPAAEMQAVARSHRIGQKKKVMVYRFISTSSIEEKIVRLQQEKSSLAEAFIAPGNPLSNLTPEQLDQILQ